MVLGRQIDSNTCCNVATEGQVNYDEKLEKLMQQCIKEIKLAGMLFYRKAEFDFSFYKATEN